ncbi:TMEM165/GDT1 family protein [Frankia sp. Mgl5]|uniref:TMEM165/GDT1 family protein n=1 Tax=Frankia sp. Mgl5 TaxID=2933793 RepID=UPI00200DC062|nr:TMEM165/GDT1 family protein [Frankia sp. Mgl5]MCK9925613.1 TMEM165/GDT1 family protein [Frankia sp. Mgl5]
MSLTAVLVTFGVIFLAELPDKTMVASLVLGSRYRPLYVWTGVAAAFVIHVTVAVAAGSAISLLPGRLVDAVAAVLFALGAVLVLREGREETTDESEPSPAEALPAPTAATVVAEPAGGAGTAGGTADAAGTGPAAGPVPAAEPSSARPVSADPSRSTFPRVAATSFAVVFVAELGDLTQFSTANLAARFSAPVAVWLGAVLALWTVAGLAIVGGRGLLRVLSVKVITRIAAVAFTALALISLVDAIRG